jgi:hypothetical protein
LIDHRFEVQVTAFDKSKVNPYVKKIDFNSETQETLQTEDCIFEPLISVYQKYGPKKLPDFL